MSGQGSMKLAVVAPSFNDSTGGVPAATRGLVQELHKSLGDGLRVLGPQEPDATSWAPVQTEACPVLGPRFLGYMPSLSASLREFGPDLVHSAGLWTLSSSAVFRWARRTGRPYLVSPHGMLDSWALQHRRWKKRLSGLLYENAHLSHAACLHALCPAEAQAIRAYGLANPICVIPNGVDIPVERTPPPARPGTARRTLVFLGRLHPKKGVLQLLEAWALLIRRSPAVVREWELVLAGPSHPGYEAVLRKAAGEWGLEGSAVHFLGPVRGRQKHDLLSGASLFVLPSFSEGLPMTVLEAWSYGVPVLMSRACNLPEGFDAGAACPGGPDVASLAAGLEELCGLRDSARAAMGQKGLCLVRERFTWQSVAERMMAVHRWLVQGGSAPDCVKEG